MSLASLKQFLLPALALLAACAEVSGQPAPCALPRAENKIPVLLLDERAKTPERAADHWRRVLKNKGEYFPLEIMPHPAAQNSPAIPSLLEPGDRSGAALVLARDGREHWLAVVVRPHDDNSQGFPVPTVTRVREKRLKQFVQSFIYFFSGDYRCSLEGFMALERKRGGRAEGGELDVWIGSSLAQLGQTEEAVRRLRQAAANSAGGAQEFEGAASLALAQLLLPRAPRDPGLAREVLSLLENTERSLRGTQGRYWAASQMALGRYWLTLSGATSVEGLRRARDYFEQAEFSFVLPRDESDAAILHALQAMTELQMAQVDEGQGDHLQRALDHFTVARSIWIKRGNEAEAEATSRRIREIQERMLSGNRRQPPPRNP